jgi:hypothetical protein
MRPTALRQATDNESRSHLVAGSATLSFRKDVSGGGVRATTVWELNYMAIQVPASGDGHTSSVAGTIGKSRSISVISDTVVENFKLMLMNFWCAPVANGVSSSVSLVTGRETNPRSTPGKIFSIALSLAPGPSQPPAQWARNVTSLAPAGNQTPAVQSAACDCTDWAVPAPKVGGTENFLWGQSCPVSSSARQQIAVLLSSLTCVQEASCLMLALLTEASHGSSQALQESLGMFL